MRGSCFGANPGWVERHYLSVGRCSVSDVSDAQLVADARCGDKRAFSELVARHRGLAQAVCRRLVRDPMATDDVVQEAVVVALVSIGRLGAPERFRAWLCGITLNVARRWLRVERGPMLAPLSEDTESVRDPAAGPEDHAVQRDIAFRVRNAVAHLASGQRDAVMLFYLEGLTHHEAAAELGISVNAVKARLHQARAALAPKIAALDEHQEAQSMTPTADWVDMRIAEVRRGDNTGTITPHVVVLHDESGKRRLPIWTAAPEAIALALNLDSVDMPRPMTYQLASSLVTATGARVAEVRITRLSEATFYAVVALEGPSGTHEVDARPSDALNLALVCDAPIRVHAEVLSDPAAAQRDEWQTYSVTGSDLVAEVHERQEEQMRFLGPEQRRR
jgi:RNA polymerase sigma factor (sigma-70 family)